MAAKPFYLAFLALLLAVPISILAVKPVVAASYVDVTVSEARVMIETRPLLVLLDVRNQSEYDDGHIRNSKLIPLWELAARLNELNKTDEILVYCGVGGRSANASGILASNDFLHVYNMLGGITEWTREGNLVYVKYPSIQEAIDNATPGDKICVSVGLYAEQLVLNKSVTLEGENLHTTIITGLFTVITVTVDNVSIRDFTLNYSGCACYAYSAVNVTSSHNVNVTNSVIESDDIGIHAINSRRVIIADNIIKHTGRSCIVLFNSSEISVLDNDITAADGIETDTSDQNIFSGNTIFSSNGPGILAYKSHENTFFHNEIKTTGSSAISLSDSHNNTFVGNSVSSVSSYPFKLFFYQSDFNSLFHNNFFFDSEGHVSSYNSTSLWDNGFEGNYWLSFTGVDNSFDGVSDVANVIDSANRDNHPLMGIFHSFPTSPNCDVDVVSNSTIDEFAYLEPDRAIKLQVSNTTANQTFGFCRISIPHELIDPSNGSISVIVDNGLAPVLFLNNTLHDDGTHRWIYFTYPHSTHEILIVPEFPMLVFLLLFVITIVMACAARRNYSNLTKNAPQLLSFLK